MTGALWSRGEDGITSSFSPCWAFSQATSSCGRGGPVPRKPGSRMVGKMIPHFGACVPNQPSSVGRTQDPKSLQQSWGPSQTAPPTCQSHPCRPFPLQMPPNGRKEGPVSGLCFLRVNKMGQQLWPHILSGFGTGSLLHLSWASISSKPSLDLPGPGLQSLGGDNFTKSPRARTGEMGSFGGLFFLTGPYPFEAAFHRFFLHQAYLSFHGASALSYQICPHRGGPLCPKWAHGSLGLTRSPLWAE